MINRLACKAVDHIVRIVSYRDFVSRHLTGPCLPISPQLGGERFRHVFAPAQTGSTDCRPPDRQPKGRKKKKRKDHAMPYLQAVAELTG